MSKAVGRAFVLPHVRFCCVFSALGLALVLGGCAATSSSSFLKNPYTQAEPVGLWQTMSNGEKSFHKIAIAEQDHEIFGAGRDGSAVYYSLCVLKNLKASLSCAGLVAAFLTVSDHQPGLFAQHLSEESDGGADISERHVVRALQTAQRDYRQRSRTIAEIVADHALWLADNADAPDAKGMQVRRQIAKMQRAHVQTYLAFIKSDDQLSELVASIEGTKFVKREVRRFRERLPTLKTELLRAADELNALFPSIEVISEDT